MCGAQPGQMAAPSLPILTLMTTVLRNAHASWTAAPLELYSERSQASSGTRRFRHSERHALQDGGELALDWAVDADPAVLLSVDAEQESGVRILHCQHNQLVLRLPGSHVERREAYRHIVASRRLHLCSHLQGEHLYRRVLHVRDVQRQRPPLDGADVTFATEELASASEVVPHAAFSFRFIPAEALSGMTGSRRLKNEDEGSKCVDIVEGWEDMALRSCADYAKRHYCTPSGDYGKGWHAGKFSHFAGPPKLMIGADVACCACGGGRSPDAKVVAVPMHSYNPECRKEARDFGTVKGVSKCAALVADEDRKSVV